MAPEDGDEPVPRARRLLLTHGGIGLRRLVFFGGKGGVG